MWLSMIDLCMAWLRHTHRERKFDKSERKKRRESVRREGKNHLSSSECMCILHRKYALSKQWLNAKSFQWIFCEFEFVACVLLLHISRFSSWMQRGKFVCTFCIQNELKIVRNLQHVSSCMCVWVFVWFVLAKWLLISHAPMNLCNVAPAHTTSSLLCHRTRNGKRRTQQRTEEKINEPLNALECACRWLRVEKANKYHVLPSRFFASFSSVNARDHRINFTFEKFEIHFWSTENGNSRKSSDKSNIIFYLTAILRYRFVIKGDDEICSHFSARGHRSYGIATKNLCMTRNNVNKTWNFLEKKRFAEDDDSCTHFHVSLDSHTVSDATTDATFVAWRDSIFSRCERRSCITK